MLNVQAYHVPLVVICRIFTGLSKVIINFLEIWRKLSMLDSDLSPFECVFNLALVNGADCDDEVARSELEGTGVQG